MNIQSHPWTQYSKKLKRVIACPESSGYFTEEYAKSHGMRLVIGKEARGGKKIALYWLIDESDGIIADAKFQAVGGPSLIGACEMACRLVLRKNHDQASRMSADLIDRELRDKRDIPAFPKSCNEDLNLVVSAMDQAVYQCLDIPFSHEYDETPIHFMEGELTEGGISDWDQFTKEKKVRILEEVIDKEIRPYIELDAGGIEIRDLNGSELTVFFSGSCSSCYSATGSTLSAIQQILQQRIHPAITVVPEFE